MGNRGGGGKPIEVQVGKVISFEPRVGKLQTGQPSGGFTVIIPKLKLMNKQTNKKSLMV